MWIKFLWIKGPVSQPDQPERFEDLALGVEPRMTHTAGAQPALLVKAFDGVWASG